MPRVCGLNRQVARFRKAALQDVHVNGRIVKQGTRQVGCSFHERKGRYAPAGQRLAPLLGLQATKNAASTDVRTQARVLSLLCPAATTATLDSDLPRRDLPKRSR